MALPSVFQGVQEFKTAVCPASNPPKPSAGLQSNNSYSYTVHRTINWQGTLNLEPAESNGTKFHAKIWDVTGLDIDQPPSAQPPRRGVGGTRALAHSIYTVGGAITILKNMKVNGKVYPIYDGT